MAARLPVAVLAATLAVAIALAVPALALPPAALRALEPDWCSAAAFARAEHARGVDRITRASLRSAARFVATHPRGCLLALRVPHARRERFATRAPWIRPGPHGDPCPRGALELPRGAIAAAERAAAGAEPRALLPVVAGANDPARGGQLRRACGLSAARRSVVVSLSLDGLLPSASLSERVVAVARFRRHGWRVYQVLH